MVKRVCGSSISCDVCYESCYSLMSTIANYWHTLRFLKAGQILGRLRFKYFVPRAAVRPAPTLRSCTADWIEPARRIPSMLAENEFCFLNEVQRLLPGQWDDPTLGKLWRYNLHYFDDLNASNARHRAEWHRKLLQQWVRENPPATGTGWEPYPTSLRIVNWIKWGLSGNSLSSECIESLATQTRWLYMRLEYHLLGNHLFSNAKALVFGGVYFSGAEADRWFNRGMSILNREVPEQILADGGHFERSPMYHSIMLEDLLDLINLAMCYRERFSSLQVADNWKEVASRMTSWLQIMLHPDGDISFFNDSAVGIAPVPPEIFEYGDRLGVSTSWPERKNLIHLPSSGYARMRSPSSVFILDLAPVGPDYLPGHAHADTLSFEGSVFGHRVFVNSGTSCYDVGEDRNYQRGTSAHNTVIVDDEDSSEVWGGFRVARRAYPKIHQIRDDGSCLEISASHDGYLRLAGKITHYRKWFFSEGSLIIDDRIEGKFKKANARFYLHPNVKLNCDLIEEGQVELILPNSRRINFVITGGGLLRESTNWYPEFGISAPNQCLVVNFLRPELTTSISW